VLRGFAEDIGKIGLGDEERGLISKRREFVGDEINNVFVSNIARGSRRNRLYYAPSKITKIVVLVGRLIDSGRIHKVKLFEPGLAFAKITSELAGALDIVDARMARVDYFDDQFGLEAAKKVV